MKLIFARNRTELDVADSFADPSVRLSMDVNVRLLDAYDALIGEMELYLTRTVKVDNPQG